MIGAEIGIDLGTSTTLMYVRGKGIVLNEPSVVSVDTRTDELIAVGTEAYRMIGRTHKGIDAVYPLNQGVISSLLLTEKMLTEVGDKLPDSDKADVQSALDKLKETLKGSDTEAIKTDMETLEKATYALSEKLYKQTGAAGGDPGAGFGGAGAGFDQGASGGASGDGTYYNADYEDKSDE